MYACECYFRFLELIDAEALTKLLHEYFRSADSKLLFSLWFVCGSHC